jgi:hypothetical protein
MKPGATTDSDNASKKGCIQKLVLITLYIIWLTILWLPNLRQCLFRQRPLLPQHTVKKSTNPRSRPPIMPYLPLEIRLCIYSYLLPDRNPVSTSRALRATCKQLDDEVRYEARTAFVRTMISMQRACSTQLLRSSARLVFTSKSSLSFPSTSSTSRVRNRALSRHRPLNDRF